MFFLCSGDQAGVIKPTALGFHLIKTLLYRYTRCKNFKRIPALRLRLVPRPLGSLQGGSWLVFMTRKYKTLITLLAAESRAAVVAPPATVAESVVAYFGSSDTRPAVHQQDGPESNPGKVSMFWGAVMIQRCALITTFQDNQWRPMQQCIDFSWNK